MRGSASGRPDRADSVQVIRLAIEGARSPNGPLVEIYRKVGCLAVEKMVCRSPQPMVDHSASLLAAIAVAINVPVQADSAMWGPVCPWNSDASATRKGVGLELGRLRFLGDSAVIFVGRSCGGRRGFWEGGMAVVRRVEGTWTFIRMRDTFIT